MAKPRMVNGRQVGWELSDDDVAEVMAASFDGLDTPDETAPVYLLSYVFAATQILRLEPDNKHAVDQAAAMSELPEYSDVRLYRCERLT